MKIDKDKLKFMHVFLSADIEVFFKTKIKKYYYTFISTIFKTKLKFIQFFFSRLKLIVPLEMKNNKYKLKFMHLFLSADIEV